MKLIILTSGDTHPVILIETAYGHFQFLKNKNLWCLRQRTDWSKLSVWQLRSTVKVRKKMMSYHFWPSLPKRYLISSGRSSISVDCRCNWVGECTRYCSSWILDFIMMSWIVICGGLNLRHLMWRDTHSFERILKALKCINEEIYYGGAFP